MGIVTDPKLIERLNAMHAAQMQQSAPQESLLDKTSSFVDKWINKPVQSLGIPDLAGGFLQGAGDVGASLANIVARPLGHPVPHPDLQQYTSQSPLSRLMFGAGELGAQLPLFASGAGIAGKIGNIAERGGLATKTALGALSGGSLGENKEGSGRLTSAALGTLEPLGGSLINKARSLKSSNIAKDVVEGEKEAVARYGKKFTNILLQGNVPLKKIKGDLSLLSKAGSDKFIYALKEFNKKPMASVAHEAQSDLMKYVASIGKPSSKLERDAVKEASRLSDSLRGMMAEGWKKSGKEHLVALYNQAREGFKKEVVPYFGSKTLEQFKKGNIRGEKFAPLIAQEEKFMAQLGSKKHPKIGSRERLVKAMTHPIAKHAVGSAIGTGLGGLGLYEVAKYFR